MDQIGNNEPTSVSATMPIVNRIMTIRDKQVLIDRDLAELYNVDTKVLNQAVKRNISRFPDRFRFQLTKEEVNELVTNCDRLSSLKHSASFPSAFTEQGVSMISVLLRSETAIETSIRIMDAFAYMRRFLMANAHVFQRMEMIEQKQLLTDKKIDEIMSRLDDGTLKARLGIFFEGQMFDAFVLVETLFSRATRRIVLIDDYVSGDILQRMRVRPGLTAAIDCYVRDIHRTGEMEQAFRAYNAQYPDEHCRLHTFNGAHDRFMIIDDEVYHFGASIKDLGKRWFGVNLITEHTAGELIARLQSPGNRGL